MAIVLSRSRWSSFFLGAFACSAIFSQQFLKFLVYGPSPSPTIFRGCFIVKDDVSGLWHSFIAEVVIEAIIMGVTLFKVIHSGEDYQHSTLFRKIFRDGIAFYLCSFALSVILTISITVPSLLPLADGITNIYRALVTILSSRLFLRMRSAAYSSGAVAQTSISGYLVDSERNGLGIQLQPFYATNTNRTRRSHVR